jgi:hypothetical protein
MAAQIEAHLRLERSRPNGFTALILSRLYTAEVPS